MKSVLLIQSINLICMTFMMLDQVNYVKLGELNLRGVVINNNYQNYQI